MRLFAAFESHKVQKELLSQRKAAKPNAAIMDRAKRIWASARQKEIPRTERERLCKELAGVVKGKVAEVVFKHDASRMIQTVSIVAYLISCQATDRMMPLARQIRKARREKHGCFGAQRALQGARPEQIFQSKFLQHRRVRITILT